MATGARSGQAKKTTGGGRTRTAADRAEAARIEREAAEVEAPDDLADLENEDSEPGVINADGSINPVEIGKRGRAGEDQVHVFTLDDVRYFIPKKPNRALLLQFWSEAQDKKIGVNIATQNALISLLGEDALKRLARSPLTTDEDVADVFTASSTVFFGAINEMSKAARGGRPADPSRRGRKTRRS